MSNYEKYREADTMSTAERLQLFDAIQDNSNTWKEIDRITNNQGYGPEVLRNMLEDVAVDKPENLKRVGQILITLQQQNIEAADVREKVEELISLVDVL